MIDNNNLVKEATDLPESRKKGKINMKNYQNIINMRLNMHCNITQTGLMQHLPLDTIRYECAEMLTSKKTQNNYQGLRAYIVDSDGEFSVVSYDDGELSTSPLLEIGYEEVETILHETNEMGEEFPYLLFIQDEGADTYSAISAKDFLLMAPQKV